MTKLEYLDIIRAIETVEENEKLLAKKFIELNPACENERINDAALILFGLMRAKQEITKRFKNILTEDQNK